MKKAIAILLSVLMTVLILSGCTAEEKRDDIVILYTNDVHCAIDDNLGYDLAIFGNHEFDYGMSQLHDLIERSNATYLACNITYSGSGENGSFVRVDGELGSLYATTDGAHHRPLMRQRRKING